MRKGRLILVLLIPAALLAAGPLHAKPAESMPGYAYQFEELAQLEHRFERLSLEHGLSQLAVYAIHQDRQGFIWFCTADGLNKYDGYSFSLYRNNFRDANSISHNYVQCICEDDSGALWLGTIQGGLNRFDPETERFTRFRHDPHDPCTLADDVVNVICQDKGGRLWIGTESGLDQFDAAKQTFIHHRPSADPGMLDHRRVRAITPGSLGQLWIGTQGGGLDAFHPESGVWEHYHHQPLEAKSLSHDSVLSLCQSRDGSLWVGTEGGGLNRFCVDAQGRPCFLHYRQQGGRSNALSCDIINTLHEDSNGHLWIGTRTGGLNIFNPFTRQFIHLRHHPADMHSLSVDNVYSLYEDRSGVMWIGTWRGGINRLNRTKMQFSHINAIQGNPNSLSDNFIWALCVDDRGLLWIGSYSGGVDVVDRSQKRWWHYKYDPANPYSLNENRVRVIHQDRRGRMWVATDAAGFARLDRETGRFTRFRHHASDANTLSHNRIRCWYEDNEGIFWIGTAGGGVNRFDAERNRFVHYRMDTENPQALSSNHVRALLKDDGGQLWVGTEGGGLNRMDPVTGRCVLYRADPLHSGKLSNDFIFTIFQDSRKRIWIGTWGGGLNRYHPHSDSFTCYAWEQGLADNVVYGILEDASGCLWMSTNKGLSRFDAETETFENFTVEDGLQSLEFNAGAYHKSAAGEFFFGGMNGVNAFFPEKISRNPCVPAVVLTSFRKLNQAYQPDRSIACVKEIELTYADYYFTLEFAALDFRAPMRNQYAYMLEGLDPDWIYTDARKRSVSYTTLAPGDYRFRVKASNNNRVWNEAGMSVHIIIHPPYWQTWWFISLLLGIAAFLIALGVRLRLKALAAVELVRGNIAADLHDHIGSSLTEISILGEVVQKTMDRDPQAAGQQAAKISDIARTLIDNMSDIVWLIHPRRDTLYDLILKLKDTYHDLFLARNILFTTSDLSVLKEVHLGMEYKHQLYLLLKEALNNCLRHSHCSAVDLIVSHENKMLEINLIDDGQGISAPEGHGNGLLNMQKRAETLGGKLVIATKANTGTMIVFTGKPRKSLRRSKKGVRPA